MPQLERAQNLGDKIMELSARADRPESSRQLSSMGSCGLALWQRSFDPLDHDGTCQATAWIPQLCAA